MENSEERQGKAGRSLLIRLAILALLPGLCFAQDRIASDPATAAGIVRRIESLQGQVNKGIVSREAVRGLGDHGAAVINRPRPAAQQPKPAVPPFDYIEQERQIEAIRQKLVWAVPTFLFGLMMLAWLLAGRPTVTQPEPQETLSDTYGTASYAHHILKLPVPYYFMQGVFFGKSSTPAMKKVGHLGQLSGGTNSGDFA